MKNDGTNSENANAEKLSSFALFAKMEMEKKMEIHKYLISSVRIPISVINSYIRIKSILKLCDSEIGHRCDVLSASMIGHREIVF